jgi:nitric oxide dioxygenase
MTPEQARLVQESFANVPAEAAATLFYGRLFELAPQLRGLFHADIDTQGKKLMAMIAIAVKGLGDLPRILPALQALGARHRGYGVEPWHYATVGEALLWTLEQGLGEHFTPAVREAWTEAYGLLAGAMIQAAEPQRLSA